MFRNTTPGEDSTTTTKKNDDDDDDMLGNDSRVIFDAGAISEAPSRAEVNESTSVGSRVRGAGV